MKGEGTGIDGVQNQEQGHQFGDRVEPATSRVATGSHTFHGFDRTTRSSNYDWILETNQARDFSKDMTRQDVEFALWLPVTPLNAKYGPSTQMR